MAWLSLIVAMLLSNASTSQAVQIIGHRGASHDAPENTLSAFKLGFEQNADANELDVCFSMDGQVVVIHDKDTQRTAGIRMVVREQPLEILRELEVGKFGKWKEKGEFTEKIPLLSEVLAIVPDKRSLIIEIKCGPEILLPLKRVLDQSGKHPEQTMIIGFDYETVKEAKKLFPDRRVLWLCAWREDKVTRQQPDIAVIIDKAKRAGLDGLDLDCKAPIDRAFVSKVKQAGLSIYTWTVDDLETARKEMEAGVDGITTNRPGWLREQLGHLGLLSQE